MVNMIIVKLNTREIGFKENLKELALNITRVVSKNKAENGIKANKMEEVHFIEIQEK